MPCGLADRGTLPSSTSSSWRSLRRLRDVRSDEVAPHKKDGDRAHRPHRGRFRLLALLLPAALVWPSTAATDTDSSQEQVETPSPPSPPLPPSPSPLEAGSSAPPWAWVLPTVALALLAVVLSAALCWMHTQMRSMRMAFVPSDPVQRHAEGAVFVVPQLWHQLCNSSCAHPLQAPRS